MYTFLHFSLGTFLARLPRNVIILLSIFQLNNAMACSAKNCIQANGIKVKSWQLGIAVGMGIKTNPLVDGDNIPLVILPDIAWYSEKAYFDNGEIGYQWLNENHYSFETFIRINQERALFSFYHPSNILYPTGGFATTQPIDPNSSEASNDKAEPLRKQKVSINSIAKRKWAINGGLRWNYYINQAEWKASFQNDISNVHKGHMFSLSYSYNWLFNDTKVKLQLGTDWKSAKLVDYYYGVDAQDSYDTQDYYHGRASLEPYFSVHLIKPISQDWFFLANMSYKKLPSSMSQSPLVQENSIEHIFVGAAYRF